MSTVPINGPYIKHIPVTAPRVLNAVTSAVTPLKGMVRSPVQYKAGRQEDTGSGSIASNHPNCESKTPGGESKGQKGT
jgi:hypothetical protein